MAWQRRLQSTLAAADALSDRARARLRRVLPARRSLLLMPYWGFGTGAELHLHGRVLRDPGFRAPEVADPRWRNLVGLYKMMQSDEVPHARVTARIGLQEHQAEADDEGYFRFDVAPSAPQAPGWHRVELELLDPRNPDGSVAEAIGEVLVPSPQARFGVISDIDDTVLFSHVRDRRRMLMLLVRGNAATRQPFHGVAPFYRALQCGDGTPGAPNPLFYVSSSPWNLYPLLTGFLQGQGIPRGPLLLKDFGDHTLFEHRDHGSHKLASIERILTAYPTLPFVLLGDSGEQDPEIYARVVRDFPERIRAIYIRCVDPSPARLAEIDRLIAAVRTCGTQLVLAPDSAFAAAHAAAEGLIDPAALAEIRADASGIAAVPPAR
jgi:phosphatidate phosphatase APP1